ncbi:hypothetical protein Tco_1204114 [Tanacetum coccineum]
MVPREVLMKSGLVSINTARQVNTAHSKTTMNAARPMSYLSKTAHSTVKRLIHKNTAFKNNNINQSVNTVRGKKINTARPKAVVKVVKGNNPNVVKASTCWVWKPKHKVLDHVSKHNRNMSYLTDYEEIDGGYVAFGENPKGGKITGNEKKSVRLMMEMMFGIELELILFWSTAVAKTINGDVQLHALVDGKKIIITKSSVRRDLQLADEEGIDCLPNYTIFEQLALTGPKTTAWNEFTSTMASAIICLATNEVFNFSKLIFDSMIRNLDNLSGKFLMYLSLVRVATTASNLETEQDSGNINKTQSKATPNQSSSQGTNSGGGPRCQETMGDTIAQTRVLDLEKTKTTQDSEIATRVEFSDDEESLGEDASKQGRINVIDANEDITLVSAAGDKVSTASAATTVSAATTTTATTVDDITLAQALE